MRTTTLKKLSTLLLTFGITSANAGSIQTHFEYDYTGYPPLDIISNYKQSFVEEDLGLTDNVLNNNGKVKVKEEYVYTKELDEDDDLTFSASSNIDVAISLADSTKLNAVYNTIDNSEFQGAEARAIHDENFLLLQLAGLKTYGHDPVSVVKDENSDDLYNNLFNINEKHGYYVDYEYFLDIDHYDEIDNLSYLEYAFNELTFESLGLFFSTAFTDPENTAELTIDIETEYSKDELTEHFQINKHYRFWFDEEGDALSLQDWLTSQNEELIFNNYLRSNNFVLFDDITYSDNYNCLDVYGEYIEGCHYSTLEANIFQDNNHGGGIGGLNPGNEEPGGLHNGDGVTVTPVPEPTTWLMLSLAFIGLIVRRSAV